MPFLYQIVAIMAVLASVPVAVFATPAGAQAPERRFALVIGNSEYKAGRQPTAANDAGLIAETLRTAGFDVAGARDLDQDTLRRSIREFIDKVTAVGPQAVSFVYLAGYGLQFEDENYIVPIDATIRRDEDIPVEAIGISDLSRTLAATPGSAKLFVVDAARQHPFTPVGPPLASGLSLVEPDPSMLIAFNASPGSIAPIEKGPYGAFAQSLAEMIETGGLGLDDLFTRLRLRTVEKTNGIAVPWYASKITQPLLFMERTSDAPPPPEVASTMQLQNRSIRELHGYREAYVAAVARDTLSGYEEFIAAFPDSSLAARVRALIAVRRENIMWRRTLAINTPDAYWSYLRRYPQGAHVGDVERRLARLAASDDPPPAFAEIVYDVSPPPPDEVLYLTQPAIVFDGPGFTPLPSIPVFFLPPSPPEFLVLAPPPPPIGPFFLPTPVISYGLNMPWARPPAFVHVPTPSPVQQVTINNKTIINRTPRGAAAPLSAALPAAVVTAANSGALKPPPPAPPAAAPIQGEALSGAGPLGNPTTPPSAQPRTEPAMATTLPSAPPASVIGPMGPQNALTIATTPDVPPGGFISPNPPRTAPVTANRSTNVPPAGQIPSPRPRPNRAVTAAKTPSPPPVGHLSPSPLRTDPTTGTTAPLSGSRSPNSARR
jgi:uncharacterized caspase-like protein